MVATGQLERERAGAQSPANQSTVPELSQLSAARELSHLSLIEQLSQLSLTEHLSQLSGAQYQYP